MVAGIKDAADDAQAKAEEAQANVNEAKEKAAEAEKKVNDAVDKANQAKDAVQTVKDPDAVFVVAGYEAMQKARFCNSLLKKHLTKEVLDELKLKRTKQFNSSLRDVIQSGMA